MSFDCTEYYFMISKSILNTTIIINQPCKLKGQLDATDWFLHCKAYCSLNMFQAPLCPSSGAQKKHPTNQTHNPQLHTRPTTCKPKRQVPQAATICITVELLMMGIMMLETCSVNNKFCNKETNLLHLVGILISTY